MNVIDTVEQCCQKHGINPEWHSTAKLFEALKEDGKLKVLQKLQHFLWQHEGLVDSIFISPFMERFCAYIPQRRTTGAGHIRTTKPAKRKGVVR